MTLSWYRWFCLLLTVLLVSPGAPGQEPAEKPAREQLLLRGAYDQITAGETPRDQALWAYARLQLAPTKDVHDVALEAHKKGEILGTFVVFLCHEEGRAVRRDMKVYWELNHALRKALADKKEPTPLECYILSRTSPADATGVLDGVDKKADDELRQKWLQQAADGGFAEAILDRGKQLGQDEQDDKAHALFDQAANLGLAAAWRTKGFTAIEGIGVKKDAAQGVAFTREAAKRGDAFAMVSLAYYHDKGLGVETDKEAARAWIEKAAGTGHWLGYLERAQSRLHGINGFARDVDEAQKDIDRALATRNRDVLEVLALWYANAVGVDRNGRKTIRYGEAAFVQGSLKAARILSHVYKHGVGGIEPDENRELYWGVQATPNHAFTLAPALDRRVPGLTERLKNLDPWDVK